MSWKIDDLRRNPQGRYGDVRQQLRLPANPAVFPASTQQKRYHSFEHSGHYTSACGPCIYRDDKLFSESRRHSRVYLRTVSQRGSAPRIVGRGSRAFADNARPQRRPTTSYASADRWSRPVMARTGPDGALWIVDMYRFMIEHPDWLPPEGREELKPFYRSGEGLRSDLSRLSQLQHRRPACRGSIRSQTTSWSISLPARTGPVRDLAQMLLIEREAVEQRTRLETSAGHARRPTCPAARPGHSRRARLHARRDTHAGTRRWASGGSPARTATGRMARGRCA